MTTFATTQADALRRLLDAAVSGDGESMAGLVTEDVIGWSPNLRVTSRAELIEALAQRDDSFSDVDVDVRALDLVGDKAIAEWHVAAVHTGPLIIDDELVVEATGRRLHLSGATIAEFDGELICAFRSYFDDLALVEQAWADE